jgi:acetolactate synthase-1/2/3 large subunit
VPLFYQDQLTLQHHICSSLPHYKQTASRLIKMFSSQAANRAMRLSVRIRQFSTSRPVGAVSPYRTPMTQNKVDKRAQSTAAAATAQSSPSRAVPSPAFNRTTKEDVQPLQTFRQPEMDHSFVGMNGGQIFHEMMLRHNVKHVCE